MAAIEDDELLLTSATSTALFYATPTEKNLARRSSRIRQSLPGLANDTPTLSRKKQEKRKRTVSISVLDDHFNVEPSTSAKRLKFLDTRKAAASASGIKRDLRDAARARWLLRHQDLFIPLLPTTNVFFDNLAREIRALKSEGAYIPLREFDEQPALVKGGLMKDYQLNGLSFMAWMYNNGMNCILGDEMGLGKTLQTLSLFAHIKETSKVALNPHLVVCPLSVLSSWETEIKRWIPTFRAFRFHGTQIERQRLKNVFHTSAGEEAFDICITTYDAFVCDDSWFKSRTWTYCVLDEGHKIKNAETNMSGSIQGISSLYRMILTGTPVQNNLSELWGLLHFLYPTIFTGATERLFKDAFDVARQSYSVPFYDSTRALLSTIMLRRTKAVVEIDVPPREEATVFLPLTEAQRFWIYRLLTRMDAVGMRELFGSDGKTAVNVKHEEATGYSSSLSEGRREVLSHLENQVIESKKGDKDSNRWKKLMNLLMQLRLVCDHPYLLSNAEPTPFTIGEHIVASSSKMIAIDKILADILPRGERVLIFSQWKGMLDLLEDFMALRSIPYARLDGATPRPRRTFDIKLFQQEKSPYQVFLISTKTGGLGINLTKASTVIMCDSDWNPQNDLQAIARAHRIGQTKTVKVYRLICRGSVEDQMLDRIRRKLFLSLRVMNSDSPSTGASTSLGSGEVMDILRKGSSALTLSDDGSGMSFARFLDAGFAEILCESKRFESARDAKIKHEASGDADANMGVDAKLLRAAEEEERLLLHGVAQVRCRLFEGKMVQRQRNNAEIAREWQDIEKRAQVDRTVVVDGMTFVVSGPTPNQSTPETKAPPAKRTGAKFDWEDWCIYCRDGGDLVLCSVCPRVFHAGCRNVPPAQLRNPSVTCGQHDCTDCGRNTSAAGGMLFRCRTCAAAYCEDCLPPGDVDAVGETLPEFLILGYGEKSTAYYIRCHACVAHFAAHPADRADWEEEIRAAQLKLEHLPVPI